jgi:hypothetical protein
MPRKVAPTIPNNSINIANTVASTGRFILTEDRLIFANYQVTGS